jgi:hypothetical protein
MNRKATNFEDNQKALAQINNLMRIREEGVSPLPVKK